MFPVITTSLHRIYDRLAGSPTRAALTKKIGGSFVVNVFGTGIAFALQIVLARLLGASSFGQYIYALTWINFIVMFGKFGLDTAALRFIPGYQAKNQWQLMRGFVRKSRQWAVLFSLFLSLAIYLVLYFLKNRLDPELTRTFYIAGIILPVSTYLIMQGSYLQALKHIVLAQAPQVIARPLLLIACLFAYAQFSDGMTPASIAMTITLGVSLFILFLMSGISYLAFPKEIRTSTPLYETNIWARAAFPMLLIGGFTLMLNQTDILIVGMLLDTTQAGIYSAASRITILLPFGITLVNSVAAPVMAQLHSQNKIEQLQRMITYIAWGTLLFSLPLCLGIVIFSEFLMSMFGRDFIAGSPTLSILAIARFITAITGTAGYLMSMSGHENEAAWIVGGSAMVNIVLNLILIPFLGLEGAAISTLITTILWTTLMVIYVKRLVGVKVTVFNFRPNQ